VYSVYSVLPLTTSADQPRPWSDGTSVPTPLSVFEVVVVKDSAWPCSTAAGDDTPTPTPTRGPGGGSERRLTSNQLHHHLRGYATPAPRFTHVRWHADPTRAHVLACLRVTLAVGGRRGQRSAIVTHGAASEGSPARGSAGHKRQSPASIRALAPVTIDIVLPLIAARRLHPSRAPPCCKRSAPASLRLAAAPPARWPLPPRRCQRPRQHQRQRQRLRQKCAALYTTRRRRCRRGPGQLRRCMGTRRQRHRHPP
jgi:hypothetical protein